MKNIYRTYKVDVAKRVRQQDGMRLVRQYGCNGQQHVVSYCLLACDRKGENAVAGEGSVRPTEVIGPCRHDKECKDFGSFLFDPDKER